MQKLRRYKLFVNIVLLGLLSSVSPWPIANAPDLGSGGLVGIGEANGESDADALASVDPFTRNLYLSAESLGHDLRVKSIETRTPSDYRRVIDAFETAARAGDSNLAARSLAQAADLMREMADAAGDYASYQKAIDTYRRITTEYPNSTYVGYALVNIAQIYEESLQDLDGAIAAYREVSNHFPNSVMGRETHAILLRLESELHSSNRPPDVAVPEGGPQAGIPLLDNVRNFTGPGYARVVLDLSDGVRFQARKTGNRVDVALAEAGVARTMYNRRFIIRDPEFLNRITVKGSGGSGGVVVSFDTAAAADYSAFLLSGPERLIIDLRQSIAPGDAGIRSESASDSRPDSSAVPRTYSPVSSAELAERRRAWRERDWGPGILTLPDVDVSNLDALENSVKDRVGEAEAAKPGSASVTAGSASTATATASQAPSGPVHCIVIDPGHGGHDTGTIGEGGLMEKDLVLEVGRRLRDFIKRYYPSIQVVMTRDSDRFVALEERTAIANSHHADLFISIHANAAPSHVASGVETYYLSPDRASAEDMKAAARENATLAPDQSSGKPEPEKASYDASQESAPIVATVSAANRVAESRELAGYIQSGLVRGIGSKDPHAALNRGVKHAPFYVLVGAGMPAVLAEISFVSNPKDETQLRTAQFREHIAASLFAGLRAYLKKMQPAQPAPPKPQPSPGKNERAVAEPTVSAKKNNS